MPSWLPLSPIRRKTNSESRTFSSLQPSPLIPSSEEAYMKAKSLKWSKSPSLLPFKDIFIEISYGKLPLIMVSSFTTPKLTVRSLRFSLEGETTRCWLRVCSREEINGGLSQIDMMKLISSGLKSKLTKSSTFKKTMSPGTLSKWVKTLKCWTNKHNFMLPIQNLWVMKTSYFGTNTSPSIEE